MAASNSTRIQYIDRLRGLAVVGMFFVHPAVAWMSSDAKQTDYFRNFMQISGLIAPTFMFLAGLSISVIAHRAALSGKDLRDVKKRIAERGIEIWFLGYGLHVLMYLLSGAGGPFVRALKVDILHCIGLTMALIPWIAFPKRPYNIAALIFALLLPVLSMLLYRLPIGETLPTYIAGYFTSRTQYALFPFIPYATWIMFGLFFGPLFIRATEAPRREETLFWVKVVIFAALMWLISIALKNLYYAYHLDKLGVEKPQVVGVPHFFWTKGSVILLLFTASRITTSFFDKFSRSFLVEFGRFSLFAYCAHLLIIYPLAGSYLHNRLGPFGHIVSSVVLTAAMTGLLYGWKRIRKTELRRIIRSSRTSP